MNTLPGKLNPHKLARQSKEVYGSIALAEMSRLNDLCLQDDSDVVSIDLGFGYDDDHTCFIKGKFTATVKLFCQRCAQEMNLDLSHNFILSPVNDRQSVEKTKYDEVLLDIDVVNVHRMIEDEILLNLPYFPSHEDIGCSLVN